MNALRPSNAAQLVVNKHKLATKTAERRTTTVRKRLGKLNGVLQVAELQLMFQAI